MKLHCFVSVLSAFFLVNKTKRFSCLHLVVLFFWVVWCPILFVFAFSFLSKKDPQNRTQQKTQKTKMQEKGRNKNSILAVVFTNRVPNFLGWATKILLLAESPIQKGFQHILRKEKGLSQISAQACCAT